MKLSLKTLLFITATILVAGCYKGDPGYGLCTSGDPSCTNEPSRKVVRAAGGQFATYPVDATKLANVVPAANGGTGTSTFPTPGSTGNVLTSNGTTWTSGLVDATKLTNVVPAANGGTGTSTFPTPGSTGNVLTSNGTTWTSAAAAGGGWVTWFDQNLTTYTTQSLTPNGTYTAGLFTGVTRSTTSTASGSGGATTITNGVGLQFTTTSFGYGSWIWIPFSGVTGGIPAKIARSTDFRLFYAFTFSPAGSNNALFGLTGNPNTDGGPLATTDVNFYGSYAYYTQTPTCGIRFFGQGAITFNSATTGAARCTVGGGSQILLYTGAQAQISELTLAAPPWTDAVSQAASPMQATSDATSHQIVAPSITNAGIAIQLGDGNSAASLLTVTRIRLDYRL